MKKQEEKEKLMRKQYFPPGWNDERVRKIIEFYDNQSDEEAIAEDEAAYEDTNQTFIKVPTELVGEVRDLIARRAG